MRNHPTRFSEASHRSGLARTVSRAVILEDHPAIAAVLEHLMLREGYVVELLKNGSSAKPGPALLLVGARDLSGLYVLKRLV